MLRQFLRNVQPVSVQMKGIKTALVLKVFMCRGGKNTFLFFLAEEMIGACDVTLTAWKLKWKNLNGLMQPLAEYEVSNNVSRTSAEADIHLKRT